MSVEIREELRESWGTRAGFVLAAVGSAVGLGNLWGFPYKLYSHGGGAFLIPYLIALVAVGVPLMILEFSLGHYTQRAAPDAFGRMHRRFEIVGWWGILLGFVIITYYPVILAYCCSYLWYSIRGILFTGGQLPWAGEGLAGVKNAKGFFFGDYLGYHESFSLGAIRWHIVVSLVVSWAAMYLCIFRGVSFVGKVVWLTVPLPWIMLLILAVRGLTLPGSTQGLAFYLNPDWAQLAKPSTWRFAFGQVFFSLSLAFGVMITYASFLHRKSDLSNNAAIIGLADLATSFVAGLAVFATLGGMAYATQQAGNAVPVGEVVAKGPGLAFVAFPYALAQLPYSAWFSLIFFLALVTLGIDSAFSITESVLASIVDKTGWRRAVVLPTMSAVGLVLGLVYVTNGGLNWLGTIDDFINGTWGIAFMGLLECVVLGWLYRVATLREHANERSDWQLGRWWDCLIRIVIPVVLGALVVWSLFDDLSKKGGFLHGPDGAWIWPNAVGLGVVALVPVLSLLIAMKRGVREPEPAAIRQIRKPGRGLAALVLAGISALLVILGFFSVMASAKGTVAGAGAAWPILAAALALGVAATVLGHLTVEHDTTPDSDPSWLTRWAGVLGTIDVGAAIGLMLALKTAQTAVLAGMAVPETGEPAMSGAGYIVLAIIGLILIGGLGWCFYRALSAGRDTAATPA